MRLRHLVLALAVTTSLTACGNPLNRSTDDPDPGTITVGSAAFPESEIVAEIYAQALESKGLTVRKKLNIGAREVYIPALERGEIDLIPEYTGNLLTYLDPKATATAPDEVVSALDKAVPSGLTVLQAAPGENKDSLNVTAAFSKENDVTSIADLAKVDGLRLAANPEFKQRAYGIPGLEKVYGIRGIEFTPISDGGGPATVKALVSGTVDVADIYSTTPSIKANKLVTLDDPKNLIAAQNVVPLARENKATDKVSEALNAVSASLTTQELLELNEANQGKDKTAPAVLAKEWVAEHLK